MFPNFYQWLEDKRGLYGQSEGPTRAAGATRAAWDANDLVEGDWRDKIKELMVQWLLDPSSEEKKKLIDDYAWWLVTSAGEDEDDLMGASGNKSDRVQAITASAFHDAMQDPKVKKSGGLAGAHRRGAA